MCRFSFSQKLASLCVIAISISVLLVLNFPAEAEVNSPTVTILDMEEMSQIAGGTCKKRLSTSSSTSGSCRPNHSPCGIGADCGTNPYTIMFSQQYCQNATKGYDECWCQTVGQGWQMYNCQQCLASYCIRAYAGSGGDRIECTVSTRCP